MAIGDRTGGESANYHRPGEAGGTAREIPDPTDEDFIEIVSTLYDAVGDDVEVFAQAIGMDREGAEEVIARIRQIREDSDYLTIQPTRTVAPTTADGVEDLFAIMVEEAEEHPSL